MTGVRRLRDLSIRAKILALVMLITTIALLLNRAVRGGGFYRAAYYLPAIMPLLLIALP